MDWKNNIECGDNYSAALKSNGAIYSWGVNGYGELCLGDTSGSHYSPIQAVNVSGITIVACGGNHSAFLKSDGAVWSCGYGYYVQMGDGNYTSTNTTAKQAYLVSGVIAIGCGYAHTLAVLSDNTVRAWGRNNKGQLGNYTNDDQVIRVTVSGLSSVISAKAGMFHSAFLKSNGTVWTCGWGAYGQLGNNGTSDSNSPVQVSNLTDVTAIACGDLHCLAIKSDKTVWAWGVNGSGRLGDGSTTTRLTPVQVSGLTNIIGIAAGASHSLFLKDDGTVWACGLNSSGQIGDGGTTPRSTPVQVNTVSNIIAVAAGGGHNLYLKSDYSVWTCGNNSSGQLGDGTTTQRISPIQIIGFSLKSFFRTKKYLSSSIYDIRISQTSNHVISEGKFSGRYISNEIVESIVTATSYISSSSGYPLGFHTLSRMSDSKSQYPSYPIGEINRRQSVNSSIFDSIVQALENLLCDNPLQYNHNAIINFIKQFAISFISSDAATQNAIIATAETIARHIKNPITPDIVHYIINSANAEIIKPHYALSAMSNPLNIREIVELEIVDTLTIQAFRVNMLRVHEIKDEPLGISSGSETNYQITLKQIPSRVG